MSDDTMSVEEFIAKVNWEGGVVEALDYGLTSTRLEDQNSEFANVWRNLERIYASTFRPAVEAVEAQMPEGDEW
jgi:hypothetical protein